MRTILRGIFRLNCDNQLVFYYYLSFGGTILALLTLHVQSNIDPR
jgi:hypothetical protein